MATDVEAGLVDNGVIEGLLSVCQTCRSLPTPHPLLGERMGGGDLRSLSWFSMIVESCVASSGGTSLMASLAAVRYDFWLPLFLPPSAASGLLSLLPSDLDHFAPHLQL